MDLELAADALMALLRANLTTLKGAPDKPPERIADFPFAIAWPGSGRITTPVQGLKKDISIIVLEIHVSRKNIPVAIGAVFPFHKSVGELLTDPDNLTLTGTVVTIMLSDASGGIEWEFGELDWGELKTIGFRFRIRIKQETNV